MRTKVFNDTHYALKARGYAYMNGFYDYFGKILQPMESAVVKVDPNATYQEIQLFLSHDISYSITVLLMSTDDFIDAEEIRIFETPNCEIRSRISIPRGSTSAQKIDRDALDRAKGEASERMKSVERMCAKIELLSDFNVFHSQCNYLIQVFSKGIQEVKESYFSISEDENLMWTLYTSKKLSQLVSSLANLLRDLMSAERLLQACGGKKWRRTAIVLCTPPPELEKYSGSSFLLLIRDFNWSLDLVRYSLHLPKAPKSSTATEQTLSTEELTKMKVSGFSRDQSGDEWKFEWCHRRCRYKLQRNGHVCKLKVESLGDDDQQVSDGKDEIRVATDEARSHEDDVDQQAFDCKDVTGVAVDQEELLKGDFDRQAHDRKDLPGNVEKTLTAFTHGTSRWLWACQIMSNMFATDEALMNKLLTLVKNRCQDTSESGSSILISKCFEIDHLDLKMKSHISGGASKRIYRASWLGQEVAVAVVKQIPREVVEKEAGFLVKVHHPNVVDFFGFALKEEALTEEELNAVEKIEPKWTGYLVMELMQEDLRSLIEKLLRDPQKQEYGGPFSLSITVDMLLQIVGAMIHTHKLDILHRDLKAKNCLVSPKLVSNSRAEDVSTQSYTVKLIDFGESKLWAMDGKQTLKKGTVRWMAPEVWQSSEYSKSADVYSFGMTCYEIITGLTPFQGISNRVIMDMVVKRERPTIPGTCPQSLSDLMKKCWAHEPKDRPTFEEIQKDLWAIKYSVDVQIQY